MATVDELLLQEALEIANAIISNTDKDDPKFADIENRKSQIESALHTAHLAVNRLSGYQPIIFSDLQCPNCWVRGGVHVALTPIPGTDEEDFFMCKFCDLEFATPDI